MPVFPAGDEPTEKEIKARLKVQMKFVERIQPAGNQTEFWKPGGACLNQCLEQKPYVHAVEARRVKLNIIGTGSQSQQLRKFGHLCLAEQPAVSKSSLPECIQLALDSLGFESLMHGRQHQHGVFRWQPMDARVVQRVRRQPDKGESGPNSASSPSEVRLRSTASS